MQVKKIQQRYCCWVSRIMPDLKLWRTNFSTFHPDEESRGLSSQCGTATSWLSQWANTLAKCLHWLHKETWLYVSFWENKPTAHLINYLTKMLPNEFMMGSLGWNYMLKTRSLELSFLFLLPSTEKSNSSSEWHFQCCQPMWPALKWPHCY